LEEAYGFARIGDDLVRRLDGMRGDGAGPSLLNATDDERERDYNSGDEYGVRELSDADLAQLAARETAARL